MNADKTKLRHTARSRGGFARGALQVAQWVVGKNGFHEFSEIIFGTQMSTDKINRVLSVFIGG
jgi:dihydrodipicolinate reductase